MKKKKNYSCNYEDFKSQKFGLSVGLIGAIIDQCNFTPSENPGQSLLC